MSYGIIYIDEDRGEDIMTLTQYQLKMYAKKFLNDTYGMNLTIPVQLNGRLKRTCGRFKYRQWIDGRKEPVCIELNKYFVENNKPVVVLDVLRHELVHYALFMQNKPNKDGHPVFENELKRLGIVSQNDINKYNIASKHIKIQIYQCADCDNVFERQRALANGGRYHRCSCGGRLIDKGKKVVAL